MYLEQTIAVVVPAYNEQQHVANVLETIPPFVDRIYAVDDASTDDTWSVISRTAKRRNRRHEELGNRPPVVPIQHERNRGAGGAVLTGYRYALRDEMDVVAVMDGDGQMNPAHLERIVAPVAEGIVGYAKGNRLGHASDRNDMSRWRLFGNFLLTQLTRAASGYWEMSDPQNGFTAISRGSLETLPLDELYQDYGFLNHVLVELQAANVRIADVAHPAQYGAESSGIRYHRFVPGLSALLGRAMLRRVLRESLLVRFHPRCVGYAAGPLAVAVGMASSLRAMVRSTRRGPTPLDGLILATVGIAISILAVWADVVDNEGLVVHAEGTEDSLRVVDDPSRMLELVGDGGPGSDKQDVN